MPDRLTPAKLRRIVADTDALAAAIDVPFEKWAHQCHAISLALVRTGLFGEPGQARVVRGSARGVMGQHSWILPAGYEVYERMAWIVDPTLWSYTDQVDGVVVTQARRGYTPHGDGTIWAVSKPSAHGGEPIDLPPPEGGWSATAAHFLGILGPLDIRGWMQLASAPVHGWPAAEILTAMHGHRELSPLVPIDHLGNATDLNPEGLYW